VLADEAEAATLVDVLEQERHFGVVCEMGGLGWLMKSG
jgi:hypothetical protein